MTDRIEFSSAGAVRKQQRREPDFSTIRGTTLETCILEQEVARQHYDEAWKRLARLIGTE